MFQCSEFTSAQCGIVKAKGVLTDRSEGPQVTSGPRRTSVPSGWRLRGGVETITSVRLFLIRSENSL